MKLTESQREWLQKLAAAHHTPPVPVSTAGFLERHELAIKCTYQAHTRPRHCSMILTAKGREVLEQNK
jgi:hypothetical protein